MDDPQAVTVSWEAVRVLALAVGVREAARRCGISEEATMKRCQREGWLRDPIAAQAIQNASRNRSGLSAIRPQTSPSQAMAQELAALGGESRLALARTVRKAAKHSEGLDGAEILENAQNVKSVAQTASLVHGWDSGSPQVRLRLDVVGASGETQDESPVIDVESSVVWDGSEGADSDADL